VESDAEEDGEAAAAGEDADAEEDDAAAADEDLDEPKGEDSYD
jgi:hypothetical protein